MSLGLLVCMIQYKMTAEAQGGARTAPGAVTPSASPVLTIGYLSRRFEECVTPVRAEPLSPHVYTALVPVLA